MPETPEDNSMVNKATDTVAGQMEGILDSGSPLMQRAEGFAQARSNQTGALGTSMAIGSAQGAVYDKALEIAKPDAAMYAERSAMDKAFGQQMDLGEKQQEYTLGQMGTQAGYDTAARSQAQDFSMIQMDQAQTNQLESMAKDFGYSEKLANTQNKFNEMMMDKKYTQDDKVLMMNGAKDIMASFLSSTASAQASSDFTSEEYEKGVDNYEAAMKSMAAIWGDAGANISFTLPSTDKSGTATKVTK